jgi:hypothetical protein
MHNEAKVLEQQHRNGQTGFMSHNGPIGSKPYVDDVHDDENNKGKGVPVLN